MKYTKYTKRQPDRRSPRIIARLPTSNLIRNSGSKRHALPFFRVFGVFRGSTGRLCSAGAALGLQGQTAGAIEAGVAAEFRGLEFHFLDADGLGPFLRFRINVTEELRRRAKYAAANIPRIREKHAVSHSR